MPRQPMIFVTGDKELDRQLRTLAERAVKKLFRKATRKGARKMQKAIKVRMPVGTKSWTWKKDKTGKPIGKTAVHGALKRSVKVRAMTRTRKGRIGASVVIGGEAAEYVSKVELGTKRMRPKRKIRDAFNTKKNSVGSEFVNDIWEEIKAEVART